MKALAKRIERLIAWANRTKPVRVWNRYARARGPLLAQGLSYQAIFAVFAALWVTFAVAGFVVRGNEQLQNAIVDTLATAIPGLIGDGDSEGAITIDDLLSASILGWTGAIAAIGLVATALGWLASGRDAVRAIFGLASPTTNPVLLKLLDIATAIGLGAALLLSAGMSIASTTALSWIFGAVGVDNASTVALVVARVVGIGLTFVVDTLLLTLFYRVLSGIPIPVKLLAPGIAVGAAGFGVLKVAGSLLLGGATANPLLASFAVILGLLIWFNLMCQVILVAASWIAESASDAGVDLAKRAAPKRGIRERIRSPRVRAGRTAREHRDA
jgi:membrane protein